MPNALGSHGEKARAAYLSRFVIAAGPTSRKNGEMRGTHRRGFVSSTYDKSRSRKP